MTKANNLPREPKIVLHEGDLPDDLRFEGEIAVDCETMGLQPLRDRLCLIQLSAGDGVCHLVRFADDYSAPNLKRALADPGLTKLFHFARFDLAVISVYLDVMAQPVYCSKIASKLARTYTDRHGLKDLCAELLGIEISKAQQSSDWGGERLSEEQLRYAGFDVLYLHELRRRLDAMLEREGRLELADACFSCIPVHVMLDVAGWANVNVFEH